MKIEDFYKEAHQPDAWVARWIDPHFTGPTDALHQEILRQWAPEIAGSHISQRMLFVTGLRKFLYEVGWKSDRRRTFSLCLQFNELVEYVTKVMKTLDTNVSLVVRMENVHKGILQVLVAQGFPTMTLEAFTENATNQNEWESLDDEQLFCYYHYILGIEILMQMEACMYILDETTPIGQLSRDVTVDSKKKVHDLLLNITKNCKGTVNDQPIHEWNRARLNQDVTLRNIN